MFEYEDKTTHFGSRKRRDTTDRQLNEIFEDIVDSCIKFDQTKIFQNECCDELNDRSSY